MSRPRILVAGIGNIFLGDDAFGVEVVRRLSERPLPETVRVIDFGIRGLDLTYALLDDYDAAILVDAVPRGDNPGTLYVLEPESPVTGPESQDAALVDAHVMNPMRVLQMVSSLGARPKQVLIVGCEPATSGDEFEGVMGLSPAVEAALGGAVALVESLIEKTVARYRAEVLA